MNYKKFVDQQCYHSAVGLTQVCRTVTVLLQACCGTAVGIHSYDPDWLSARWGECDHRGKIQCFLALCPSLISWSCPRLLVEMVWALYCWTWVGNGVFKGRGGRCGVRLVVMLRTEWSSAWLKNNTKNQASDGSNSQSTKTDTHDNMAIWHYLQFKIITNNEIIRDW